MKNISRTRFTSLRTLEQFVHRVTAESRWRRTSVSMVAYPAIRVRLRLFRSAQRAHRVRSTTDRRKLSRTGRMVRPVGAGRRKHPVWSRVGHPFLTAWAHCCPRKALIATFEGPYEG
jgi:hypothetical protein